MSSDLLIGLSAVIVSLDRNMPVCVVTRRADSMPALPYGKFDPAADRTFELALRGWVSRQTGFALGHVEQLYTFGDQGRDTPHAVIPDASDKARTVSVGYLALTAEAATPEAGFDAEWQSWYAHFPWEDHRAGRPSIIDRVIAPHLQTWAAGNAQRLDRARLAFGHDGQPWGEERALERYELMYEAGLVVEATRDAGLEAALPVLGDPMASDHRRILATAISRLRSKLKYRPVLFDMMPDRFTLSSLQTAAEAILGLTLHKQNFRRSLDRTGLVEGTGAMETGTGGRPAEYYRFRRELLRRQSLSGIAAPALRRET